MITIDGNTYEGFYSFSAYNVKTKTKRDLSHIIAKEHENLVLNSGLNALGTTSVCSSCVVGTGNSEPVATQTSLDNQKASTSNITAGSSGRLSTPPYYMWGRRTYRFAQGVASGNLTEVGLTGSGSNLFSRALIVDTNGSPTTLTILNDEWLDVTYELRCYQNLEDIDTTVVLDGVTHQVKIRPASVATNLGSHTTFFNQQLENYTSYSGTNNTSASYSNGTIGSITGSISGTVSNLRVSMTSYTQDSFRKGIVLSSGLDDQNINGGISAGSITTYKGSWQMSFTPAIPKDNFKTLVLTFYFKWGPHDPES